MKPDISYIFIALSTTLYFLSSVTHTLLFMEVRRIHQDLSSFFMRLAFMFATLYLVWGAVTYGFAFPVVAAR